MPSSASVAGSGTVGAYGRKPTSVAPPGVAITSRPPLNPLLLARLPVHTPERLFWSNVTAPVLAKALPQ